MAGDGVAKIGNFGLAVALDRWRLNNEGMKQHLQSVLKFRSFDSRFEGNRTLYVGIY